MKIRAWKLLGIAVALAGLSTGFGVGLWQRLGGFPFEAWGFIWIGSLVWTGALALTFRRAVTRRIWAAAALGSTWVAVWIGDFVPCLLNVNGESLSSYNTASWSWGNFALSLIAVFSLWFIAGLVCVGIVCLSAGATRLIRPSIS